MKLVALRRTCGVACTSIAPGAASSHSDANRRGFRHRALAPDVYDGAAASDWRSVTVRLLQRFEFGQMHSTLGPPSLSWLERPGESHGESSGHLEADHRDRAGAAAALMGTQKVAEYRI